MALIDLEITDLTQVVVFRANNAPEMQLALNAWFAGDNDDVNIFDCQLVGGGACPRFLCSLTVGEIGESTAISFLPSDMTAVVVGGMDSVAVDPIAMAATLGAAIQDIGATDLLAKAEIASGGVGPHWMGLGIIGAGR